MQTGIPRWIMKKSKTSFFFETLKQISKEKYIYSMFLPVLIYYVIFAYWPMYGIIIAFKEYVPTMGFGGSPWVGFEHFVNFFNSVYFLRIVPNTLLINVYSIAFAFPAPIIFALLLNEVKGSTFKRTVQTISYLPHFISLVVAVGFVFDFLKRDGLINDIIALLGFERIPFMSEPGCFRMIYTLSEIWQEIGWGSIIYFAALCGIDSQLYEAAIVDGAGRWKQLWHVTLPCLAPTIIILLILKIGNMMYIGTEKIILMYNPLIYDTADVISSYVYRKGLLEFNYSYSTAVNLFNNVINLILLVGVNRISRKFSESSLW